MIRLLCIVLCLAGCAATTPTSSSLPSQSGSASPKAAMVAGLQGRDNGARAADIAYRQVGEPYRYGGAAPGGFDCSGLVHYAYQQVGVSSPRTTAQLWQNARRVERDQLQAGDILFFNIDGKPSHVGVYLGGGQFVHAPSSGKRVSVQSLDAGFYQQAFLRGGRLANLEAN